MSDHFGEDDEKKALDTTPAQMKTDEPERPENDEAEGAENSANPVTDEARPDNLNTMGY